MTGVGAGDLLAVAGGGAIGACSRYLAGKAIQSWAGLAFPLGTLVVNVLGCLLLGFLFARVEPAGPGAVRTQLFLTTGLLGGFTTFSTFSQETVELMLAGRTGTAAAYAGLSLGLCLLASLAATWMAATWLGRPG